MLANFKEMLGKAQKQKYAVGAFNINNLEVMQSVVRAATKLNSPVILATSEGAIEYAGLEYLYILSRTAAELNKIPIALHLDHGKDPKIINQCISIGYSSIMFDGSHLSIGKNMIITKRIVEKAQKHGIHVEAEIGTIGGAEDKVKSKSIILTEPAEAKRFVDVTGVDALAIAIGTSHGAYKFTSKPKLDIQRLKEIRKKVKIPLVLHGASGVPKALVKNAAKYGAVLGHPEGVPDDQIALAIKNGISKVNTDTDLRMAFNSSIRENIAKHKDWFDPKKFLGPARDNIEKVVEHRMKVCRSINKAR